MEQAAVRSLEPHQASPVRGSGYNTLTPSQCFPMCIRRSCVSSGASGTQPGLSDASNVISTLTHGATTLSAEICFKKQVRPCV